jgi:hypothetical protein
VAVARDDLRGNRLHRQAHLLGHIDFDAGVDVGKGAHRARNRAGGDVFTRRDQTRAVAGEFGIGLGQLLAEGGRFGVDAVAAPDGGRVLVLERAALDGGQQRVNVRDQDVGGRANCTESVVSSTSEVMP